MKLSQHDRSRNRFSSLAPTGRAAVIKDDFQTLGSNSPPLALYTFHDSALNLVIHSNQQHEVIRDQEYPVACRQKSFSAGFSWPIQLQRFPDWMRSVDNHILLVFSL